MKKLIISALVVMSAIAVNGTAMAHSGDIKPYVLWNIDFGAKSSGTVFKGHGVVWSSADGADGANNVWNYYYGTPNPDGSMNVTGAQAYEATSYLVNQGDVEITAPVAHNVNALHVNGYIMSNESKDITLTMTVPGFESDSGHAYVYTQKGYETADLLGIAGSSTSVLNKMYTWSENGVDYDVSLLSNYKSNKFNWLRV
jgi:hypothetical protein